MIANKGTDSGDQPDINPIQTYSENASNNYLNVQWRCLYESISRCNNVINVANTAVTNGKITQDKADWYIMQARVLRGWYHLRMEIMEKLNPLLLEVQAKGGVSPPPIEIPSLSKPSLKSIAVDVTYFYQKGCPKCDRANALLKYMAKKYPQLNIKEIDLHTPDGKRLNETLSSRLNLPAEKRLIAPSIFIGNNYLSPDEITQSEVEALIQKYEKVSVPTPSLSLTPEESKKRRTQLYNA
jgi:thiol-disulfide isomerase/thioredoxin